MASVDAVKIQNTCNQIIKFLYKTAPNYEFNITDDVAPTQSGTIQLAPQKQIVLQASRIDLGQLANLEAKGVIKTVRALIESS